MKPEQVILVTPQDRRIGTMEKLEAHRRGLLHRCISIVVYNTKGEMLLQRRAMEKYHSPGLWANTACSHQRPGERSLAAAHRRLPEEMGFDCLLKPAGTFTYRADVGKGLIEHEFDHVFVGVYDGMVRPNPEEVMEYAWRNVSEIRRELKSHPEKFAKWFPFVFSHVKNR